MKHVHYTEVEIETPEEEGIKNLGVRWVISKKDGAENFAMRVFEIQPGGHTPLHQHDWEHEIFILEGSGITKDKTNEKSFKQGDIFYIPPMEWHQFVNNNDKLLKIICLIPYK
jgi:quercetin dioxygenase-like cupin family protein